MKLIFETLHLWEETQKEYYGNTQELIVAGFLQGSCLSQDVL